MRSIITKWKLKVIFSGLVALALFTVLASFFTNQSFKKQLDHDRFSIPYIFNWLPKETGLEQAACIMPVLSTKSAELDKVYAEHKGRKKPKVDCRKEKDWVAYDNGVLTLSKEALAKYDSIQCDVTYVQRVDDFRQKRGQTVKWDSQVSTTFKMEHDFAWVECQSGKTFALAFSYKWSSLFAGISRKETVVKQSKIINQESPHKKLNILMFGFDSVSRLNFIRKLPKLYSYLTNDLKAFVLEKYNIVGDGTTAAMLGMLVGKYETELPETRKGKSSQNVDVYPFVFKNLSEHGYVTTYGEDESSIGTFHYRLNGFKDEPTDHYMRPFHLVAESEHKRHPTFCLGSVPKINVLTNYLQDTFTVYPEEVPKFVFGFHSEYSHGVFEELVLADEPVTTWLKQLKTSGILDDTILIVMSDHGHRFSYTRGTLQGKYEERLPFFSVVVPPTFQDRFPNAYRALTINAPERLTSPFDVRATFDSILEVLNKDEDMPKVHKELKRGMSLFSEIPASRTCEDAEISAHWCACNNWVKVDPNEDHVAKRAAEAVISAINDLVNESHQQDKCVELKLSSIKRSQKMLPKKEFLKFKETSDGDGRVPDFAESTKLHQILYEVQLTASPSEGLFEATVIYLVDGDKFVVNAKEISRVNKYGLDSHCVGETFPHLAKFCYCKVKATKDISGSYMKVVMG
ncbi:hypothetical protein HDE_13899 [Halotydeus destructor]|nr:hypothetical protein HDE_13899 [Halotydeus destructor]